MNVSPLWVHVPVVEKYGDVLRQHVHRREDLGPDALVPEQVVRRLRLAARAVVDVDRPHPGGVPRGVRHRHVRVEDEAELDDPEEDEEQREQDQRELDEALTSPAASLPSCVPADMISRTARTPPTCPRMRRVSRTTGGVGMTPWSHRESGVRRDGGSARGRRAPPGRRRRAKIPPNVRSVLARGRVSLPPMPDFQFVAPFQPTGDQPQAIERDRRRPRARLPPPDAARRDRAPARPRRWPGPSSATRSRRSSWPTTRRSPRSCTRVPRVLPRQRGRVLRQLLRLLPARGVPAPARTRTSRRTRHGTTRSTGSATPRPTPCSSGAT